MKTTDLKAEDMTTSQLDRWLAGRIPRRILVAPFGGPRSTPYYAKGMDLDGEFFHERTDFTGPYPALRQSRDRLVDFHHATFMDRPSPAERAMKGAVMGRVVLDEEPEDVDGFIGLWGDFWANAGEKRRELMAWLEKRGHQLYGSTQPIQAGVRKGQFAPGSIDVWPIQFHTITTSPQNTLAVVPALKAVLDDPDATEVSIAALRALAADLSDLGDLQSTSRGRAGDDGAKSGRVGVALSELDRSLDRLRAAVHPTEQSGEGVQDP